jgi:O-antigen/teichoic acid export membrane protein
MLAGIRKIGHVSAYQYFQISRLTAVILISIILVKSGYDTEKVSHYERFIFLANLFSFFWVMGIKNAALAYFPKLKGPEINTFFTQTFLLLQLTGLFFGILLFFLSPTPFLGTDDFSEIPSRFLLSAYLIFYAPTVLIEVFYILKEKATELLTYGTVIHGLQIVLLGVAALRGADIAQLFQLLLLWMLIKWTFTLYLIKKNSRNRIVGQRIKKFILFSLPLIGHLFLSNGMEFIDGILVNRFFDPGDFAVFRYGARELPFILIMVGALSSSTIPMAVISMRKSSTTLKKHSKRLMHLFYPLAIVLMFISPYLFQYFYSEEYLESATIFNIYLLILASRILLPEVFLYGKHKNQLLMWISMAELLTNLGLSLLLLPKFGLPGIAAATVIAYALSKIAMLLYLKTRYGIRPNEYIHLKEYTFYTLLLFLAFFIQGWM